MAEEYRADTLESTPNPTTQQPSETRVTCADVRSCLHWLPHQEIVRDVSLKTFFERLKACQQPKETDKHLAERAGVPLRRFEGWKYRGHVPGYDSVLPIAHNLGVCPTWLWIGSGHQAGVPVCAVLSGFDLPYAVSPEKVQRIRERCQVDGWQRYYAPLKAVYEGELGPDPNGWNGPRSHPWILRILDQWLTVNAPIFGTLKEDIEGYEGLEGPTGGLLSHLDQAFSDLQSILVVATETREEEPHYRGVGLQPEDAPDGEAEGEVTDISIPAVNDSPAVVH